MRYPTNRPTNQPTNEHNQLKKGFGAPKKQLQQLIFLLPQDLSDMVAEHAAKQKKKRKAAEAKEEAKGRDGKGGAPQPKKYKEFKF